MTAPPPPRPTGGDARAAARLEVWQHRLAGICDEAGEALRRGAYSPNIKERADFSVALFDPDGTLVAQAEHIPVHLGSMAASVEAALAAHPDLGVGDHVIVNDPFRGGTHLNDITFVTAVADTDGTCLGYVANRAHHADIGGAVPGSLSSLVPDSVAEGLCLPPVRAVRADHWDPDVRAILLANTRTPVERGGDLDAQWGANRLAARRLAELATTHGTGTLHGAMRDLLDYGERRMRAALSTVGAERRYRFSDHLEAADGDLVLITVDVQVGPNGIHADFRGTAAARPGVPCAVASVTRACVEYVARCVTDPDVPRNGGASRLLSFDAPVGSVVAATFPTPVGAGNVEASQRVVDVLFGALAGAFADRVGAASQGTMNNLLIGANGFVYYETIAGGQGGHPHGAGMSGVQTHMTNTANTPVEALELEYPLRVRRYTIRRGTGGTGARPGGSGIERAVEVLVPATVSLLAERRRLAPWGLDGGGPGAVGDDELELPDGRRQPLAPKSSTQVEAGTVVVIRTPGGGGHGTPDKTPR